MNLPYSQTKMEKWSIFRIKKCGRYINFKNEINKCKHIDHTNIINKFHDTNNLTMHIKVKSKSKNILTLIKVQGIMNFINIQKML
jgi:hypothetical protein